MKGLPVSVTLNRRVVAPCAPLCEDQAVNHTDSVMWTTRHVAKLGHELSIDRGSTWIEC